MLNGQPLSFIEFLAFFAGLYLVISTFLGALSGWFRLQRHYPRPGEPALLTLGAESAWMGGVNLRGCLVLSAAPSGLHVALWPLLAPLHKPFAVPWTDIYAQHVPGVLGAKAQLSFGNDIGSMRIKASSWEALVAHAPDRPIYN